MSLVKSPSSTNSEDKISRPSSLLPLRTLMASSQILHRLPSNVNTLVVDGKEAKRDVLGLVQPATHTPEITHPYHALEDVVGSGGLDSERVRKLPNVERLLNAGLSWAIDAQEARQGSDDREWSKGKQRRYWKSESEGVSRSPPSEFGEGSTNRT